MARHISRGYVNLAERISSKTSFVTGANLKKKPPKKKPEKKPGKK